MQSEYLYNKIASVLIPTAFIVLSLPFFTDPTDQWRFLLFIVVIVGYTHYFIGGFYQVKAFSKKTRPALYWLWFTILTAIAVLVWWYCFQYGRMIELAFFTIPYFMIHGFFNEQTFVSRMLHIDLPPAIVGSLSIWLASITTLSFFHPSAYFDMNYEYRFQTVESVFQVTLAQPDVLFLWAQIGGILGVVVAFGLLFMALPNRAYWLVSIPMASLGTFFTGLYFYMGSFNYVYLFFLLLMFHFLTWMFFYAVRFYERSISRFVWYVFWHLVIVGVSVMALFATFYGPAFDLVGFVAGNSYIFLLLTTIHITTSFLNEPWFERYVLRIENR